MRHSVLAGQAARVVQAIVGIILVDVGPVASGQLVYSAFDHPGKHFYLETIQ